MKGHTERGAVMVWALIFVIVTSGMIISHSAYMASHRQTMDVHLKRKPLAATFARAALTDGLSWFQAQASQPVVDFAPRHDLTVNPPVLDTQDPTLGLVREFEIRGNLWGRYEIRRDEVMDMSLQYGATSPGSVWDLAARGFVYRKVDPTKQFDEAPNKVVSTSRVETTIRSVPLNLPSSAAIGVDDVTQLSLGPGGKVIGGNTTPGVAAPVVAIMPSLPVGISGTPTVTLLPVYLSQPADIFRMSLPELRDVSDLSVASGLSKWLAEPLPENSVVYHDGDLTITASQRLAGSMLLVVNGSLLVEAGSNSQVTGVMFVTGSTELRGPFLLKGMLVAKGSVLLQGNGTGQDAVVQYDAAAVQRLVQSMSRYRGSRVVRSADKDSTLIATTTLVAGSGTTVANTAVIAKNVIIGNNVQVMDYVGIDQDTTVGDNTTLGTRTWLGKAVQVGSSVAIGGAKIDDFAVIGDGATISAGVSIGAGARIAPGAVVPPDTIIRAGAAFP